MTQTAPKTSYSDSRQWTDNNRDRLEALIESAKSEFGSMFDVSLYPFGNVKRQMEALELEGYPYIHCRTFAGWQRAGRQVRKGEKCQLWSVKIVGGSDEENPKTWPKTTNLFHINQTDPIDADKPIDAPAPRETKRATTKRARSKGKTAGIAVVQNGVNVTQNKEKNGIEIRFDCRPDDSILNQLKSASFRWSRASGCWYAIDSDAARVFAYSLSL